MKKMERNDIYMKCDREQKLQLNHFVALFKVFVTQYNKKGDNGYDIEKLVFAVDNGYWRQGDKPMLRPDIGYDTPWQSLILLEELSGIKLKYNPDLDEDCRLNDWIEINRE